MLWSEFLYEEVNQRESRQPLILTPYKMLLPQQYMMFIFPISPRIQEAESSGPIQLEHATDNPVLTTSQPSWFFAPPCALYIGCMRRVIWLLSGCERPKGQQGIRRYFKTKHGVAAE
jgi:hypothetical protein